jgi:hypothetical protein
MAGVLALAGVALAAAPADAAKSCFKKAAEGVALTESLAKFQVDAALLPGDRLEHIFHLGSGRIDAWLHVRAAFL